MQNIKTKSFEEKCNAELIIWKFVYFLIIDFEYQKFLYYGNETWFWGQRPIKNICLKSRNSKMNLNQTLTIIFCLKKEIVVLSYEKCNYNSFIGFDINQWHLHLQNYGHIHTHLHTNRMMKTHNLTYTHTHTLTRSQIPTHTHIHT